jgi:hypothetical protein
MGVKLTNSGLTKVVAGSLIERITNKISVEDVAKKMSIDARELSRIEMGLESSRSKISSYISAVSDIKSGKYIPDDSIRVTDRICDVILEFGEYANSRQRLLALITSVMLEGHKGSILAGVPSHRITLTMFRQAIAYPEIVPDVDLISSMSLLKSSLVAKANSLQQLDLVTRVKAGVIYGADVTTQAPVQEVPSEQLEIFQKEETVSPAPINRRVEIQKTQEKAAEKVAPAPAPAPAPTKISKTEYVTHDPSMSIADLLKDAESAVIEVSRFKGPNGKVLYVIEVAS